MTWRRPTPSEPNVRAPARAQTTRFRWRKTIAVLEYSPRQLLPTLKMENDFLTLHTSLAPEVLREKLRRWEPWSRQAGLR